MNSVASSFEIEEFDHVVANLKDGPACFQFFLLALVPQVTNKLVGDPIQMHDRFQSKVVIAFEHFHRLFFRFEFRRHGQLAVCDLFVPRRRTPSLSVDLAIKIVGVDERARFEQL